MRRCTGALNLEIAEDLLAISRVGGVVLTMVENAGLSG